MRKIHRALLRALLLYNIEHLSQSRSPKQRVNRIGSRFNLNLAKDISGGHRVPLVLVPLDDGALGHGWRQRRHLDLKVRHWLENFAATPSRKTLHSKCKYKKKSRCYKSKLTPVIKDDGYGPLALFSSKKQLKVLAL